MSKINRMLITYAIIIVSLFMLCSCSNSNLENIVSKVDSDSSGYKSIDVTTKEKTAFADASIIVIYENTTSGKQVFDVVSKNGRNGNVEMAILIENNMVINIAVISHQESEDHADRVFKDSYLNQYKNIDLTKKLLVSGGVPSSDNDIVVVSGATITSNAVLDCVNAVAFYLQNK